MQIHELPSGSPSQNDYLPFDDGAAAYKAPFSGFDVGGNQLTFTSGDTTTPSVWQTVSALASGTVASVMEAVSKMIANVRFIWNKIGTTAMGTTATTVTGAIAEHEGDISGINTKIGNTAMGTTATTVTGAIKEHEDDIGGINDDIDACEQDIADINTKLGSFAKVAQHTNGSSANVTYTDTLTAGSYILIVSRSNSTVAGQNGLYLIRINALNSSILAVAASSVATVSVSGLTLTTELTSSYANAMLFGL